METQNKPANTIKCDAVKPKPIADIELIIHHLNPISNTILTSPRQVINYSQNGVRQCFLLRKGSVSLYRISDGLVVNSESAPYVFGLSNQYSTSDYLSIRTQEDSEISMIPLIEANRIIAHEDLWKNLAHLLMYTAGRIYEHSAKMLAQRSYDVIRFQLYELMEEQTEMRMKTTAANYIQSRTFLSRSSIMKILAQLKLGGYIVTERGILLSIERPIPLKY
ncbi:cyclic nucleotide-binding protein [Buttiauxella sp. B2]|nr:helix-turn-helix domain-containing protein [Buttiauxella sp. B2]TNV11222.1 cyclic nucleotide-binding protein [Buttiauxella sp. B2]